MLTPFGGRARRGDWHWPYFAPSEFDCRCGCGANLTKPKLLDRLSEIRAHFGPVRITSGTRCAAHNRAIGGAQASRHLTGEAADITVDGVPAARVQDFIAVRWRHDGGLGRYDGFTHIDVRPALARWQG